MYAGCRPQPPFWPAPAFVPHQAVLHKTVRLPLRHFNPPAPNPV